MALRIIEAYVVDVVLVLFARAAFVNEEFRKAQIALVARAVAEPDKRQLYLLVAGGGELSRILGDKDSLDIIGVVAHQVKEFILARGFIICDSGFDEVTRAVKLMEQAVGEAVLGLADGEIDVEVAAGIPVLLNKVDNAVNDGLKLLVGALAHRVGDSLYPFRDVRIPEEMGLVLHALVPVAVECGESSRLAESLIDGGNRHIFVDVKAVFPETAEFNFIIGDSFHIVTAPQRDLDFLPSADLSPSSMSI